MRPVYYVLIAVLLWSTGGVFIKLTALDAYELTFYRSLLAAVTVLLLSRRVNLRLNGFVLLCSVIYAALLFLFVWATKHTTAANAIFLQYTAPIYILILGPFVIGERFHWADVITVVLCIAGMSMFFIGRLDTAGLYGNIAALGSGIFLGLYIMLLRHPRAAGPKDPEPEDSGKKGSDPVITVIYGNLILAVLTAPWGVAALPSLGAADAFYAGFLGIVQIGIAYVLFIKGVTGGTRPLDASIIGFIEPILNPVWVFLFYFERPSNWAVLGGVIIIFTVAGHTIAAQYRGRGRLAAG